MVLPVQGVVTLRYYLLTWQMLPGAWHRLFRKGHILQGITRYDVMLPVPDRAVLLDSSKCPFRGSPSRFLLLLKALVPASTLGGDSPPKPCPDSWDLAPPPGRSPGLGECLSWTLCLRLLRSTKNAKREADKATIATPATAMPAIAPVPMLALAFES